MTESKPPYKGSCLCHSITFEVDVIEPNISHCHCSMCRKFHGAAFATYGIAKKGNFRWLNGEEYLSSYLAPNGTTRKFCKHCGSSLIFSQSSNPKEVVEFAFGVLDSEIPDRPEAHIFVGSKANWNTIHDDLPQYLAGRNNEHKK